MEYYAAELELNAKFHTFTNNCMLVHSGHNTVQAQLKVPFKRGELATCITYTSTPPPVHPHTVHLYTCTFVHTSPALCTSSDSAFLHMHLHMLFHTCISSTLIHLHTVHLYTCTSIHTSPVLCTSSQSAFLYMHLHIYIYLYPALCMYIFTQYIFTHAPSYVHLHHFVYLHTVHFYACTSIRTYPALCTSSHRAFLHMHIQTYISSSLYIFTLYVFSGHNTVQTQLTVPFKRGESAVCITSTSTPPPVHPHTVHLYTCTFVHTSPAQCMYVFTQCFFTHAPLFMHLHMYTCTSIHASPALCTSSHSASVHMHLHTCISMYTCTSTHTPPALCTSSHSASGHMHRYTYISRTLYIFTQYIFTYAPPSVHL